MGLSCTWTHVEVGGASVCLSVLAHTEKSHRQLVSCIASQTQLCFIQLDSEGNGIRLFARSNTERQATLNTFTSWNISSSQLEHARPRTNNPLAVRSQCQPMHSRVALYLQYNTAGVIYNRWLTTRPEKPQVPFYYCTGKHPSRHQ